MIATTRHDCRTNLKAFWKLPERAVRDAQATAQYDTGEILDTETKSKILGAFLLHDTNYPLPERVSADHYQVLSRDGVTRHNLTRADCFSPWQCSCEARGYCWHLGYMDVFEISGVFLEEHITIDDLAPAPTVTAQQHAERWQAIQDTRAAHMRVSDDEFTCLDYGYPPAPVHPDDLALPVQSLAGRSILFAPEEIAS